MYNSSIFDSAADSIVTVASTSATVPNDTTTVTSLTSKMDTAKFTTASASATAGTDDDEVDWQSKDDEVVMRDKVAKQGQLTYLIRLISWTWCSCICGK